MCKQFNVPNLASCVWNKHIDCAGVWEGKPERTGTSPGENLPSYSVRTRHGFCGRTHSTINQ